MTKSTITRNELNEVIATYGKSHLAHRMATVLLAAMDSEPDCKERKLFCSTDTARMRKVISVSAGAGDAPLYRHAQHPVVLNGFSVDRMEVLADRLTTRITSLEIHERAGNISSTQQETLDAFRIALEVLALAVSDKGHKWSHGLIHPENFQCVECRSARLNGGKP